MLNNTTVKILKEILNMEIGQTLDISRHVQVQCVPGGYLYITRSLNDDFFSGNVSPVFVSFTEVVNHQEYLI